MALSRPPFASRIHLATTFALAGLAISAAPSRADAFKVNFEAPGVQSANRAALCATIGTGTCTIGVETFDSQPSRLSFATDFGTGGVIKGAYSPVQINAADQFGGAGGIGRYPVAFSDAPYKVDLTTSQPAGINYFGFWLSALDLGNQVSFYRNGNDIYDFTPASLTALVGACPDSTNPYCGNPNSGAEKNQPFAFLNFFDTAGTFDSVHFNESPARGGYESDNHTVGYFTAQGSVEGPEPASLTIMGGALTIFAGIGAIRRRRT